MLEGRSAARALICSKFMYTVVCAHPERCCSRARRWWTLCRRLFVDVRTGSINNNTRIRSSSYQGGGNQRDINSGVYQDCDDHAFSQERQLLLCALPENTRLRSTTDAWSLSRTAPSYEYIFLVLMVGIIRMIRGSAVPVSCYSLLPCALQWFVFGQNVPAAPFATTALLLLVISIILELYKFEILQP